MPAFSVGKQKKLPTFIKGNNNPGVGSYQSQRKYDSTLLKSPSYMIGKTKKLKTQNTYVPGANTYLTQKKSCFQDKNRGFHIVGKRKQRIQSQGPGPASYQIQPLIKTKLYTFGLKCHLKSQKQDIPGPAQYSPKQKKKNIAISFQKSKRPSFQKQYGQSPGPGEYQSCDNMKLKKNKFSFTKDQKFIQDIRERKSKQYPGQFNYNLSNINVIKKKSAASKFGTANRKNLLQEEKCIPSPAQYNIKTTERRSPNAIIGSSTRSLLKNKQQQPGPAKYSITNINKIYKQQPSVKFGSSPRESTDKKNTNPGVGSYNIDLKQTKNVWTITGRKSQSPRQNNSPGPQDYDPNFNNILRKSEIAIIGGEKRKKYIQQQKPGPGDYNIGDVNKKSKTFYFNKEVKKENNNKVPGPGSYNLKTIIGSDVRYEQ